MALQRRYSGGGDFAVLSTAKYYRVPFTAGQQMVRTLLIRGCRRIFALTPPLVTYLRLQFVLYCNLISFFDKLERLAALYCVLVLRGQRATRLLPAFGLNGQNGLAPPPLPLSASNKMSDQCRREAARGGGEGSREVWRAAGRGGGVTAHMCTWILLACNCYL